LVNIAWVISAGAAVIAVAALLKARRLAKRLERLTESYWELRYDHGQLRARVNRLDPDPASAVRGAPGLNDDPGRPAGTTAFVPLSSLKR
jgi:hypothetical protein